MTNLQQYAAEIIVNNETGETFMSLAGIARICGVSKSSIQHFARGTEIESKTAEILTAGGLQAVQLFPEKFIA